MGIVVFREAHKEGISIMLETIMNHLEDNFISRLILGVAVTIPVVYGLLAFSLFMVNPANW